MASVGDWLIDRGWRGRLVRLGLLPRAVNEPDDRQADPVAVSPPDCHNVRTMVVLTAGQSNAANAGSDPSGPFPGVFNLYGGRFHQARDPLLGASGQGGSVWIRFSRKVIEAGLYQQVVIVPVAIGGTRIAHWVPGGELSHRIPAAIAQCKALGLGITHVIWHQGESDTQYGTSQTAYAKALRAVIGQIRANGVPAPVMVCRAARMRDIYGPQIIKAQEEVISSTSGVIAGPNTDDLIGVDKRFDDLHFNGAGFDAFASALVSALPNKLVDDEQSV